MDHVWYMDAEKKIVFVFVKFQKPTYSEDTVNRPEQW